jgi:hypothetical protein
LEFNISKFSGVWACPYNRSTEMSFGLGISFGRICRMEKNLMPSLRWVECPRCKVLISVSKHEKDSNVLLSHLVNCEKEERMLIKFLVRMAFLEE